MSPRATITAVGSLAVLAELGLGGLGLAAIGPEQIVLFLLASAVATAVSTAAMHRLLRPRPDDAGPGEGGVGPGPDDSPPGWWPAFEADFRSYAEDRQRTPA
ncbi:MAG TPA: hypothetical protein VFD31_04650 [Thermoleophilaceae bacterium]|nr:hypothetical protein [Thermoleophilaceae bacterium]